MSTIARPGAAPASTAGALTPPPVTIGVITNPNSKKNRALKGRAASLAAAVGARGVVRETRTTGDIATAINEMRALGVRVWVSDGGDGALHWLLNEMRPIFAKDALALPLAAPTNGGTIDFVAKKVGIRGDAHEVLAALTEAEARGRSLAVDELPTFLATGTRVTESGAEVPFEKIGFAAALAGIGQRFFDLYYMDPAPGPKTVVSIIAKGVASIGLNMPGVRALPFVPERWRAYVGHMLRPQALRVTIDGEAFPLEAFRALHVGSMFVDIGGVVRLFPLAVDGRLHVMIGNPSPGEVVRNLPSLFRGKLLRHGLTERPAGVIEVEAQGEELLAPVLDGEVYRGIRRLRLEAGPRVRVPRVCVG